MIFVLLISVLSCILNLLMDGQHRQAARTNVNNILEVTFTIEKKVKEEMFRYFDLLISFQQG